MVLGEPKGKRTLDAEETATPSGWNMSQRESSKAPRPVYMETASGPDSRYPDVHTWSLRRDLLLRAHAIPDPYREVKELENRRMLSLRSLRRISSMIGIIPL